MLDYYDGLVLGFVRCVTCRCHAHARLIAYSHGRDFGTIRIFALSALPRSRRAECFDLMLAYARRAPGTISVPGLDERADSLASSRRPAASLVCVHLASEVPYRSIASLETGPGVRIPKRLLRISDGSQHEHDRWFRRLGVNTDAA